VLGAGALYLRARGRLAYGFWVAGVLFVNYRGARRASAALPGGADGAESLALWEDLHRSHAIFLYESIVGLQGWWVKAGQYLSSRADVMPPAYVKELGKLQDSIPNRPLAEVVATIRQELPPELAEQVLALPLSDASYTLIMACCAVY
jgi:aarF domain-containing kinase